MVRFEGEELEEVLRRLDIAASELWGTMKDGLEEVNPLFETFEDIFDDLGRGIADALFVAEDALEALRNTARKVIEEIIQEIFRLTITQPLKDALGPILKGAATFLGGFVGAPRAQFGAQFAVGGAGGTDSQLAVLRVSPRELITVEQRDDRRRQARQPQAAGNVNVTLNINGVSDADSFRRSESRVMDTAYRAAQVIAARNANR